MQEGGRGCCREWPGGDHVGAAMCHGPAVPGPCLHTVILGKLQAPAEDGAVLAYRILFLLLTLPGCCWASKLRIQSAVCVAIAAVTCSSQRF